MFAIYAFLPAVALSAMPVHETPALSQPPGTDGTHYFDVARRASTRATPCQGIVQNLGLGAAHDARELLRRPARGDDPDHRHERGPDRRLAPHLLDGRAPAVPRRPAHGAPDLAHAVGRDRGLHDRGDRHDRRRQAGRRAGRGVPRQPLRVRRDALVHDRARLGDRAARAQVQARSRAALPRAAQHARRRASTSRSSPCSAASARSPRSSSSRRSSRPCAGPGSRWLALGMVVYVVYRKQPGAAADEDRLRRAPRCAGPRSRSSTARSCCT